MPPEDREESSLVRKEPCPACGSRDNLARYSDGHAYCFSQGCGHYERGDGQAPGPASRHEKRMDLIRGSVEPIANRGLTDKACAHFNYQVGEWNGRKVHIAPYHDESGRLVAQKIRWKADGKKQFTFLGSPREATLFGQHLCRSGGKMVVVTEGEIDAVATRQALGDWPVVSLPNGAGGARRDLAKQIAWLETFQKIVLLFDMDEPGRKAVDDCVTLFTPGKVFTVNLPVKDAGEMVETRRGAELAKLIQFEAKPYRPDGIMDVDDLIDDALEPARYGLPWPWRTLTERTYGIHRSELVGWGAGVGSGKTTIMKQLMLTAMRPDLLEDHGGIVDGEGRPLVIPPPRPVGVILFEEKPKKTLRTLAGMVIEKRVNKADVAYDAQALKQAMQSFRGLFFPLDCFGAKDWPSIKAHILYLVLALGVKDVFLDPLTALVAGAEDERRELDMIMADLSGMVETHEFTLHYVSHLTTPAGTPHEEGGRVMEKHFTGSRALARWTHRMIGVERNKQEEDSATLVRGLKDRETGEAVGPLIGLTFDRETGHMRECDLPVTGESGSRSPFKDETLNADL